MAKKRVNKNRRSKPPAKKIARTPLWALERDGITHTGIKSWQQCPEQFSLRYIEGLVHKSLKEPLVFGSLFHQCLEYRGKLSPIEAMALYREQAKQTHQYDRDYMNALEHLIHKVAAIFPAYEKEYPLRAEARCIRAEKSFSIPVEIMGVRFNIRGKRDREIAAKGKKVALQEVKTKSKIDQVKIRHLLRADLQTLIYLWSMWKETGKVPAYLLYDVIKRPQLRVTRNETLQQHYTRVAKHAMDARKDYFFRWKVDPITERDLVRFENETLFPTLRAIVSWWLQVRQVPFARFDAPLHHQNLSALSDPYLESDYYDLLILGKRENYLQLSSPHPELSE